MAKKVLCFVIILCMLCNLVPLTAFASEKSQQGYVKISIVNNGSCEYYTAKLKDEKIYMSIENIGHITGYDVNVCDFISFIKSSHTDYITFVDVMFDGVVEAQGKEWRIDLIYEDDEYYLPLAEMLYLLHAQWTVEDETLLVQQLPENITDFLDINMSSFWNNRTNPTQLLINGESELAHTLRSSLAAMFVDFDIFNYIDWDMSTSGDDFHVEFDEGGKAQLSFGTEPKGADPFVGEQYEKALLQLSLDDEKFLTVEDQTSIAKLLGDSKFKQIKYEWDIMNKTMEFPTKIPETAEELGGMLDQIESISREKTSVFFDSFGDLSGLKDVPWKKYTDFLEKYKITTIVDFLGKCVEVSEIYQRSQEWDSSFVEQLRVLTDFDETGYNTSVTDYIKEKSRKIVDEYGNKAQATRVVAIDKIFDFVAGIGLDLSPLGLFASMPNITIAGVSMISEDAKIAFDSATLAYMVDCLIKTEHVALVEMSRSYEDMLALCVGSDFDENNLRRLRNATMLSLRCNLRNSSFIYYLNTLSNDEPNWEQTEAALEIRKKIQEDYAAICNLMETEGYDRVLIRTDLDNLFNLDEHNLADFSEYGDTRQKFGLEIFQLGVIPGEEDESSALEAYSEILDLFYNSISCNWSNCDGEDWENIYDPDNASFLFWIHLKDCLLDEIGYELLDINGDGKSELIISPIDEAGSGTIYELYTILNEQIIHIASAGERWEYKLAEDYSINSWSSGSANLGDNTNYRLDSSEGKLKVNQAIIYDGWTDPENPYYYSTEDYYSYDEGVFNHDVLESISEEEALALIDGLPENISIELIPFSEYVSNKTLQIGVDFSSESEQKLKELAENYGIVSAWEYADYDGNGTYEGFAVITDENWSILKTLFVSSDGNVVELENDLNWSLYQSDEGYIRYKDDKAFFWADIGAYGSGWKTILYSVKNNIPYKLQLSCRIQGFYDNGNEFYTTENEFNPEGGHMYPKVELLYDSNLQEFVKGEKIM